MRLWETVSASMPNSEEYAKAPSVTRTRLYLESLKEVVPQMGRKIILDEDASQVLPLLQLQNLGNGGRN